LFFGEQHENFDFLYREDILDWKKSGVLSRLDLAWSRDSKKKEYVQHKLWEKRDEFWSWFENGANIYICGDKARMAADVEKTIVNIAIEKGAVDNDPAAVKSWLREHKKNKRYQLDVY
jgi:sulfite reductase (NADPH) flavoprotein alpha-component